MMLSSACPEWFAAAVATPTVSRYVEVGGCPIHYRLWPGSDDTEKGGLLFVHGSAAHSHWWDHIAPSFMENHAVAAIDLSGMGESGRRPSYRIEDFAAEVAAVLEHAGFTQAGRPSPIVVAHSFGAFATAHLALGRPELIGRFVIIDAHLAMPAALRISDYTPFTTAARTYATREEALARFRLIPPQPDTAPYILDHIARHSVHETSAGWMWKFEGVQLSEENVGIAMFLEMESHLPDIRVPAALIYGERSTLVLPAIARHIADCFPPPVLVVEIPNGHHHLMLDQPLALIAALGAVLGDWSGNESNSYFGELKNLSSDKRANKHESILTFTR